MVQRTRTPRKKRQEKNAKKKANPPEKKHQEKTKKFKEEN
jgi:hypothetical protein